MLSNSCRYGIMAVIYLASQPTDVNKTGIKKISGDLGLPMPFLAKILQQLTKQKILSSTKGPHGGFSMLKDPEKITLLDIVDTIDGNEVFRKCVMHNGLCGKFENTHKRCPLHDDYEKTRTDLISLFGNKTISELVKRTNHLESFTI